MLAKLFLLREGWIGRLSAFGLGSKICGYFSHPTLGGTT